MGTHPHPNVGVHLCPHLQRPPQATRQRGDARLPQTSAASTPSRAIVKSLPSDEPREPIAQHVPANLQARALIAAEELAPNPKELVRRIGSPDTVEGWQALADSFLTEQSCVFHRNLEISSGYAWIYISLPTCLKWAGMASFASHHVRLALYPYRLHTDRSGYSDIPRSLRHRSILLLGDVNTVRRDEQRDLRRHLLGAPRVCVHGRRDRTSTCASGERPALRSGPRGLRDDRRGPPRPGRPGGIGDGAPGRN